MKTRKVGDTGLPISGMLTTAGSGRQFAAGSTFALWMKENVSGATKIAGSLVTVVSPIVGFIVFFTYSPSVADMDTPGEYSLEIIETLASGAHIHYPSSGFEPLRIERGIAP